MFAIPHVCFDFLRKKGILLCGKVVEKFVFYAGEDFLEGGMVRRGVVLGDFK